MLKINHKKAQAVTELAVFGVILIYLLGTIVRTAVGNSLTQNENFKAMRMAMLESWQWSTKGNISRNSASVLLVEDRLSPDFNKYGDLDRNPYVANGTGTFSYELLYPLTPGQDNMPLQMPVMDVYVNGQYFPFTTAEYVTNKLIASPGDPSPGAINSNNTSSILNYPMGGVTAPVLTRPLTPVQCLQNQSLRYRREWVGSGSSTSQFVIISASQFDNVIEPINVPVYDPGCAALSTVKQQKICQAEINGANIFAMLIAAPNALIDAPPGVLSGNIDSLEYPSQWARFENLYANEYATYFRVPPYPSVTPAQIQAQLTNIKTILDDTAIYKYKLFYTIVANPLIPETNPATPAYQVDPPTCSTHPCTNQELSSDLTLYNLDGTSMSNANGDLMFDFQRNNVPITTAGSSIVPTNMRPYMAWQWAATAGTTAGSIGLNTSNNAFPNYDIDGRLKEVTIYSISCCSKYEEPTVSYSDPQLGDIDGSWDANSCAPKPGLQNDAQVYTFTQNGTYLQIKEGQLLNPETGQVVRSQTKRDTIDIVQRSIQLSNDTRRFCNGATPQPCIDYNNDPTCTEYPPPPPVGTGNIPNPVEVCIAPNTVDANGKSVNCFSSELNIKSTCFDENDNMLYVRSRLQDLRGHLWITNTSGQLKVQQ